jgi:hypothetical protein
MTDTAPAAAQQNAAAAPSVTLESIRAQQNFSLALAAGLGTAVVAAGLWAVVTVITNMELGIAAVALGYLVGRAIRETGKGYDPQFGYLGAACALFGCVLGNFLSAVAFFAQAKAISFPAALGLINADLAGRLMVVFFSPMDLLFYGIAIYEGYRFAFKYHRR